MSDHLTNEAILHAVSEAERYQKLWIEADTRLHRLGNKAAMFALLMCIGGMVFGACCSYSAAARYSQAYVVHATDCPCP